jgi:hypothetical protein
MPDSEALAIIASRGSDVREIANGIFDKEDRRTVLNFVSAAEKVAAERTRTRASDSAPRG